MNQNDQNFFADNVCKCIFFKQIFCIILLIQFSLEFVPEGLYDNNLVNSTEHFNQTASSKLQRNLKQTMIIFIHEYSFGDVVC